MISLTDSYGRRVRSVRMSLTDRCNFRCVYCTPPDGFDVTPGDEYLTLDEVVRLTRLLGARGVTHVRLTGGEPLLRRDIVDVVAAVRAVGAIDDLSMTTNASRLAPRARALRDAGLDRVNISLDSLDPKRFNRVARADQYRRVLDGIESAIEAGFGVKVNVVALRGMADDEVLAFVAMAIEHDIEVRFLEFMPLCGEGWQSSLVYPIGEVREVVAHAHALTELPRNGATAQTFALGGGRARVGFIGSLTEPFCDTCSRIRISAHGTIRPCLFSDYEVDLKSRMRAGASDAEVMTAIEAAVLNKPAGSDFAAAPFGAPGAGTVFAGGPLIRRVGG